MITQIIPIKLGMVNCYLLKEDGLVMIDAGIPGRMRNLLRWLEKSGVCPTDIDLVILTHGHMDHVGLAKDIKELTGAKLAIHRSESGWLETGEAPVPPGTTTWGRLVSEIGQRIPSIKVPPTSADILIGDEGLSLDDYGISGDVIHTPGHTLGSVSILIKRGDAFVGDLAMSARFMRLTPGFPIFAEDIDLVFESWRKLVASGAKRVYPAHGNPFGIDFLQRML
jgi:glyoxylase-like metal-dependent hydrolase (beta-lactamase superfamily II)